MELTRKQSKLNFPKNEYFSSPETQKYGCVSGGKKYSFFEKLSYEICPFALLPITTSYSPHDSHRGSNILIAMHTENVSESKISG